MLNDTTGDPERSDSPEAPGTAVPGDPDTGVPAPRNEPPAGLGGNVPSNRSFGTYLRTCLGLLAVAVALSVLVGLAFVAGAATERAGLLPNSAGSPPASSGDANFTLIEEAWQLLHTQYVGASDLDSRQLAYDAIRAMTDGVGDTGHTMFLTPDELEVATTSLSGSYAGIGAEMDTAPSDEPVVVGVFRDTPADRAGLRPGDVVVKVDDLVTKGTPLDVVVAKVRGEAGTPVTLTVRRDGEADLLTLRIVREKISIPTTAWAMVPGTTVGIVRVEQFSQGVTDSVKSALQEMLAGANGGPKATGIILDLRGNPGGYVTEAVGVASQFLASGVVYRQRDASGAESSSSVTPGGVATSVPLVVLVDGGTASAAEIVTGAIQDARRGKVVGVRTFGTGTVLSTFDLSDGSALRIGTVEWLTPSGRRIWHDGLLPDVTAELASGVRYLVPDDLRTMTAVEVAASKDTVVLAGIEILMGRKPGS